jgi:hypothetical protein
MAFVALDQDSPQSGATHLQPAVCTQSAPKGFSSTCVGETSYWTPPLQCVAQLFPLATAQHPYASESVQAEFDLSRVGVLCHVTT